MNRFLIHFAVIAMFIAAMLFTSCKKDVQKDKQFFVTFVADNGSSPTTMKVTEGKTVPKPEDPVKDAPEGLYKGPPICTFNGWYNGNTPWDFDKDIVSANITLKAKWSTNAVDISKQMSPEILTKAVSYVNANASAETTFTLVLASNVTSKASQLMNVAGAQLTIVGTGATRTISFFRQY